MNLLSRRAKRAPNPQDPPRGCRPGPGGASIPAVLVAACFFHLAHAGEAPVWVEVDMRTAGRPLVPQRLGEIADARRRPLAVTRLDLLLSGMRLRTADGRWIGPAGWHGHFRAEPPARREPLAGIPAGTYTAVRFAVGVDPQANHADPNRLGPDDPLHPVVNGMHWGWTGGYIFMALEGHWQFDGAEAGRTGGYSYHLAGDENRVEVTVPGRVRVEPGAVLRLRLDAGGLMKAIDIARDGESTHSRQPDAAVRALRAALRQGFRAEVVGPVRTAGAAGPARAAAPAGPAWTVGTHMPSVALPADNPPTPQGVELGRRLFHDRRLSRDGSVSCASCHDPARAFADPGRAVSVGVGGRRGGRNAMPLFNLAWAPSLFWDGRAPSLRRQALLPIEHPDEMAASLPEVVARLEADPAMAGLFRQALGGPVTAGRIGLAIEQYLLTRVSQDSKFDRVMRGAERFTPGEKRGFELFLTEHDPRQGLRGADCFHCHGGPLFTNHQFMNIGLAPRGDTGREQVTGQAADRGKFRTPSLRNVAVTAPYMHDGRFATLEEVIDHYDHGMARPPQLDPNLAKHPAAGLGLSAEDKAALVAFLRTLTDPAFLPAPAASRP